MCETMEINNFKLLACQYSQGYGLQSTILSMRFLRSVMISLTASISSNHLLHQGIPYHIKLSPEIVQPVQRVLVASFQVCLLRFEHVILSLVGLFNLRLPLPLLDGLLHPTLQLGHLANKVSLLHIVGNLVLGQLSCHFSEPKDCIISVFILVMGSVNSL